MLGCVNSKMIHSYFAFDLLTILHYSFYIVLMRFTTEASNRESWKQQMLHKFEFPYKSLPLFLFHVSFLSCPFLEKTHRDLRTTHLPLLRMGLTDLESTSKDR